MKDRAAEALLVKVKCLFALAVEIQVRIQGHLSHSSAIFRRLLKCSACSIDDYAIFLAAFVPNPIC
jgi:hypothetical protein